MLRHKNLSKLDRHGFNKFHVVIISSEDFPVHDGNAESENKTETYQYSETLRWTREGHKEFHLSEM